MANQQGLANQQSMYGHGSQTNQTQQNEVGEPQSPRVNTTISDSQQRNSLMQGSYRGVLSRHEGPLYHTPRGVAAA